MHMRATLLALALTTAFAHATLIKSASSGNLEEVKSAVASGADLNERDSGGNNALMWASWNGHSSVVEALLDAGADVHAHDGHGNNRDVGDTALTKAAWNGKTDGHLKVARALLEAGANMEWKNGYQVNALMNAASKNRTSMVGFLLCDARSVALSGAAVSEAGGVRSTTYNCADVNSKDQGGVTALHKAAWEGHLGVIELLVRAGADVNVKRDDGVPPIVLAESNFKRKTVQYLKKHGAKMPEMKQQDRNANNMMFGADGKKIDKEL